MGTPTYQIPPEIPAFDYNDIAPDGIVWIVCRLEKKYDPERRRVVDRIQLQGVGLDKETAVRMCRDGSYFIGPVPANVCLPERLIPWIGVEWPLADRRPEPEKRPVTTETASPRPVEPKEC